MIAKRESVGPQSGDPLPNSSRVYVDGRIYPEVRVPFREIQISPTKLPGGGEEVNAPVRVYDCSGPWGDPVFSGTVEEGLPAMRREWILKRGDVEEYEGRRTMSRDDGYLSEVHASSGSKFKVHNSKLKSGPLRASAGHPVTQLWYARQGIVTPEMEFIAIRENQRNAECGPSGQAISRSGDLSKDLRRNDLGKQHAGSAQGAGFAPSVFGRFPQRIPAEITPEFVRSEVAARTGHHPGEHQSSGE